MRHVPRRRASAAALALALLGGLVTGAGSSAAASAAPARSKAATGVTQVDFPKWTTLADFQSGTAAGVTELGGDRNGVQIATPIGTTSYHDSYLHTTKTYAYST